MALCPAFRANGFCDDASCKDFHPNLVCELCGVATSTKAFFDAHMKGFKHAAMVKASSRGAEGGPKRCTLCNIFLASAADIPLHEKGRVHQNKIKALGSSGRTPNQAQVFIDDGDRNFECAVCEIQVWQSNKAGHEKTARHIRKERFLSVRAALDEAERDKNGISITPSGKDAFDFGLKESGQASREFQISIQNPVLRVVLQSANTTQAIKGRSRFSVDIQTKSYIQVRAPLKGVVTFDSRRSRGRFQDRLELIFYDVTAQKKFAITRSLSAIVSNHEDYEVLKPSAPYIPKEATKREVVKEYEEGIRPPAIAQIETDLERYDQEAVTMQPDAAGRLYFLQVPGLAEKRPSVIVGDCILVKHHGSPKPRWWGGYVHVVRLNDVGLCFNNGFKPFKGQKFDVRFLLGRLPLRRMHQALDTGGYLSRLLFPTEVDVKNKKPSPGTIQMIKPANRAIGGNPQQILAVTAIRNLLPGSPPFVVFGPPGTGKTVTIVEAIRQILEINPEARVFACAPSNSAADLIAERLTVLTKSQLFRLNAPSRSADLLPKSLAEFSRKNDHGTFYVPPLAELRKFRVVVSTCISASVPHSIGIPPGHFTHVFVDEVGQACEPEAIIAIKTLADEKTNLIISGDPKQLGPIIRSGIALQLKLGVSFLDRLTELPLYDHLTNNGVTIVKLLQNFRSHPSILNFPNQRFYQNELECRADVTITHSLLKSDCLAKAGFPVVFHSIVGKDVREARSPSFFNVEEASLVKEYVQRLKEDKRLKLVDENIGVISPYNAQCSKIRLLLSKFAKGIKVGSVEEFQGQERRVMIISTVRSNIDFVQSDITHSLGFIANPRRFNVAITRAQALLIVIGDPNVLSLDPLWRSFMSYIYNNGGWTGHPEPDWDTNSEINGEEFVRSRREQATAEESEMLQRLTEVIETRNRIEDLEDVGDGYEAIERPWRETD
ncbi:hypothetical protein FRC20_006671 [Serendipita sp. 405]|nr:hypothetical protein FRC20_006671 [Serendipita sp. 405]